MTSAQGLNATIGLLALIVLVVVAGIAVKMYDRKRKREDDALALQAMMSDALLAEPRLSGLVITPTVRASTWGGLPVTVEVGGVVPRSELRELAIQLLARTAGGCTDLRIEDRVVVDPFMTRHAA